MDETNKDKHTFLLGKNNALYRRMVWASDGEYLMREGPAARLCSKFLAAWYRSDWLYEQCRLDGIACGIAMGEVSPWWTLTWWCCLPSRAIQKLCIRSDRLYEERFRG